MWTVCLTDRNGKGFRRPFRIEENNKGPCWISEKGEKVYEEEIISKCYGGGNGS